MNSDRFSKFRADERNQLCDRDTDEISSELRAQKHKQFIEQKRRQLLRENNHELRELEKQLQSAYISKQLSEQKADLRKRKEAELRFKNEESARLELERQLALKEIESKEQLERQKKTIIRDMLKNQIIETRKQKLNQYEQVLNDRENMQKLLKSLEMEEQAELISLKTRKQCIKQEMEEFARAQKLLKLKEEAREASENDHMRRIIAAHEEATQRMLTKKRQELEQKQAISEKIGQELFIVENEKRNRDNVLLELLLEERKAKEDFIFRKNLERQEAQRLNTRQEMKRYREELAQYNKDRQMKEEAQLREEQSRMLAERDKLEQLSDQRRRQKELEHRRDIQSMVEERRRQRNAEASEKLQAYENYLQAERQKQEQIEDERIRLLRSQPSDVLRFLPAGVLREADREFLPLPPHIKEN